MEDIVHGCSGSPAYCFESHPGGTDVNKTQKLGAQVVLLAKVLSPSPTVLGPSGVQGCTAWWPL